FLLVTSLKLWIAWNACATLAEARRSGAIELLLATPLRTEDIVLGHWQAFQRLFLGPICAVAACTVVPMLLSLVQQRAGTPTIWLLPVPAMSIFGIATLVLDAVALAWVGMWMGLTQAKPMQAFAKTVIYVSLLPTLIFCIPNFLFDLFWIAWAKRKLAGDFRR